MGFEGSEFKACKLPLYYLFTEVLIEVTCTINSSVQLAKTFELNKEEETHRHSTRNTTTNFRLCYEPFKYVGIYRSVEAP